MITHTTIRRGFTLVEVLVVVAIIGILVSVVSINFNDAREVSRDRVRMADLKQLKLALEVYKAQNGSYPAIGCGRASWTGESAVFGSCSDYIVGLAPEYIPALPKDPGNSGDGYIYTSDGSSYKVLSHHSVESLLVTSLSDEFSRCPVDCGELHCGATPLGITYSVYSAGAECW